MRTRLRILWPLNHIAGLQDGAGAQSARLHVRKIGPIPATSGLEDYIGVIIGIHRGYIGSYRSYIIRLYKACDIFLVTFPARALRSEIQNLEIQYLHVHPDGLIVELGLSFSTCRACASKTIMELFPQPPCSYPATLNYGSNNGKGNAN